MLLTPRTIEIDAILDAASFLAGAVADTENEIFEANVELRHAQAKLDEYYSVHRKRYGRKYMDLISGEARDAARRRSQGLCRERAPRRARLLLQPPQPELKTWQPESEPSP